MVHAAQPPLVTIPLERQQAELRRAQEREASERLQIRPILVILAVCFLWQLAGAGLMLASAHTTDVRIGNALFAAAFAVGYGGAFFSLVVFYVRGQERGDW